MTTDEQIEQIARIYTDSVYKQRYDGEEPSIHYKNGLIDMQSKLQPLIEAQYEYIKFL
jgi:hypothetical protein